MTGLTYAASLDPTIISRNLTGMRQLFLDVNLSSTSWEGWTLQQPTRRHAIRYAVGDEADRKATYPGMRLY